MDTVVEVFFYSRMQPQVLCRHGHLAAAEGKHPILSVPKAKGGKIMFIKRNGPVHEQANTDKKKRGPVVAKTAGIIAVVLAVIYFLDRKSVV